MFDTAILFGLDRYLHAPAILGAIVIFRLYYYVIPLFLAGTLFAGNELLLRGGALMKSAVVVRAAPGAGPLERAGLCDRRRHRRRDAVAASCCWASAWCHRGPTSPGWTPTTPTSRPRPASSSRR